MVFFCAPPKEPGPVVCSLEDAWRSESRTRTARYEKAPGSDRDYDVALCCLLFLRAVRFTDDFLLACSHALVATFGDVVLFYRLDEDPELKYRAILVQTEGTCTEEALASVDPFRLQDHLNSIKNPVVDGGVELLEISLVANTDGNLRRLRGFVNSGGRFLRISEPRGTGVLPEPERSDFPGRFLLCSEQADFLEEELCRVLRLTSVDVAGKLASQLKQLMKAWWSEEGTGRHLTTESREWISVLAQVTTTSCPAGAQPPCLQRNSAKTVDFDTLYDTKTLIFSNDLFFISKFTFDKGIKVSTSFNLKAPNTIVGPIFVEGVSLDLEIRNLCSKLRVRGLSGGMRSGGFTGAVTEFLPFTWLCEEKVVVVDGLPGEGMSSFLNAMFLGVKEEFPEACVLRLDMAKCTRYIEQRNFTKARHFKELLLQGLAPQERNVIKHSLDVTGNIFLFVDAFEDIGPDFTAKCCALLKGVVQKAKFRQLVVATRPVTTKDVQKTLETRAFTLPAFSEEKQTSFLEWFSSKVENNDDGEEIADDDEESTDDDDDGEIIISLCQNSGGILEVPLSFKFSDEVYADISVKFADPWRNVFLYKMIVDHSVQERLVKMFPHEGGRMDSILRQNLRDLQELAVRERMTSLDQTLEQRTFSEYFLGCWLSRHWRRCPRRFLRDALFRGGSELVAATFSWSLFEDSPLHLAVARGDDAAVRALLVSPGTTDRGGRSPLHVAAMTRGGNRQIWELLVASGEDLDLEDEILRWSAIRYAETSGNVEMVDFLLEEGVEPHQLRLFTDENAAREVVVEVIKKEAVRLFRIILGLHKTILATRFYYEENTLLHFAAAEGSVRIARVLLELGHPVDARNIYGDSPVVLASRCGHWRFVRFLLESGGGNVMEDQALTDAALLDRADAVRILLDNGADPNSKDHKGDTALILAAKTSQGETVRLLLDKGADHNVRSGKGHTPLTLAAAKGRHESVRYLLEKGADPDAKGADGNTPSILAAMYGHHDTLALLLSHGADPDGRKGHTGSGTTALIEASWSNRTEMVRLLRETGADPDLRGDKDKTALMWAVEKRHVETVALLLEMGAHPDVRNKNGETVLMRAASRGRLNLVRALLEAGAALDLKNSRGETALFLACKKNHLEVVKLLYAKGADVEAETVKGETASQISRGQTLLFLRNVCRPAGPT